MASQITTKKGDDGHSQLYSGERLHKNAIEFQLVGLIDKLQSEMGVARTFSENDYVKARILFIQQYLFGVMSEVATRFRGLDDVKRKRVKVIDQKDMDDFEKEHEVLEGMIDFPKDFVVPGAYGSKGGAFIDVARCTARECERKYVEWGDCQSIYGGSKFILRYLNRLSDHLWLLARLEEGRSLMREKNQ